MKNRATKGQLLVGSVNSKAQGTVVPPSLIMSANGAITIKHGVVFVTKGSICAMTLADPTAGLPAAGGDDARRLTIIAATAFAHTVTNTTGFNAGGASNDVATFGGAVGDTLELVAYNGKWHVVGKVNITIA